MSDTSIQAGAPAAAAAADGAGGEHRRQGAAGEVHQHHAGHRHRHLGLRFHGGQVHRPAAAQPPAHGAHLRGRVRAGAAVEELGTLAGRRGTTAPPALIGGVTARDPGRGPGVSSRGGGAYIRPRTSRVFGLHGDLVGGFCSSRASTGSTDRLSQNAPPLEFLHTGVSLYDFYTTLTSMRITTVQSTRRLKDESVGIDRPYHWPSDSPSALLRSSEGRTRKDRRRIGNTAGCFLSRMCRRSSAAL